MVENVDDNVMEEVSGTLTVTTATNEESGGVTLEMADLAEVTMLKRSSDSDKI